MHILYTAQLGGPQASFDGYIKECTKIIKTSTLVRPCTDKCY